jgi:uncharacterized protein YceK
VINSIRSGFLLITLLALTACGTYIGRSETTSVDGDYYRGTKGGLLLLGISNSSGVEEAHGATVFCWMSVVCPVITLISLPIDIAIDTALIPYDAVKDHEQSQAL